MKKTSTVLLFVCAFLLQGLVACSTKSKDGKNNNTETSHQAVPTSAQHSVAEKSAPAVMEKSVEKTAIKKISKKTEPTASLTCAKGKDIRVLEVKGTEGNGCELIYTKADQPKTIATAKAGLDFCSQVSERVQKNIEAAGLDCK
jgi:hypothetical protein